MNYYDEYRSKLKTPEQAVRCVKSGDWSALRTPISGMG